jgi:hypothetical protein
MQITRELKIECFEAFEGRKNCKISFGVIFYEPTSIDNEFAKVI